jgi:hypothetical protein
MSKCDNCHEDAYYKIENNWAAIQHFCEYHLPAIYNKKQLPDFINKVTPVAEPIIEEVKPKKVKKTAKAD